jgi:acyl dehydratase
MVNAVIRGVADLRARAGQELGTSEWLLVDQTRIGRFAEATEDRQWIHVDPHRAATGPWGGTIAHGFLTLSLIPALLARTYRLEDFSMVVNYGLDRVRFPAPVPAGSRIRAHSTLSEVVDRSAAVQGRITVTVEIEGDDKPACIAEMLGLYYPA